MQRTTCRTALVYHERFLWHDPGSAASVIPAGGMVEPGPHAESPERIRRLNGLIEVSGLGERLERLRPRPATLEELRRFHTADYVERVRELSDGAGGDAGEYAPVGPSSFEIAVLAAGACLTAVDAVVDGSADNAYALVRPPGHHALAGKGMGGCLFSNTALAALHAREAHGLSRGRGRRLGRTPRERDAGCVLRRSERADDLPASGGLLPPGSGGVDETGAGEARDEHQHPASAGLGHRCVRGGVRPRGRAGARRAPAGARARRLRLRLERLGPARAADAPQRRVPRADARNARAWPAAMPAGGSSSCTRAATHPAYTPFCGLAVLEELSGISTGVEDPFLPIFEGYGYQELQPHQEAVDGGRRVGVARRVGIG